MNTKIPLFKVFMASDVQDYVMPVIQSGYIGQGAKVDEFEKQFEQLIDAPRDVISVNSCTSALDLALHLIGVGPGDEVITTPQTCTATNGVIVNRGARPVWADIDPTTGNIDPSSIRKLITKKTKAIMAVDWGGLPSDYSALKSFGFPVIEDAAHSLLATINGQSIAKSGGDYVCWSFQAIKHLTTTDGGALLAPIGQVDRARLLRWYGLNRRSKASFRCEQNIQEVGYKYHMNDVAAAVGLANISHMPRIVNAHRENARIYCDRLRDVLGVHVPTWTNESSWWLYTIRVSDRDAFMKFMSERDIDTSPVHARNDKHSAFNFYNGKLPGVTDFSSWAVAIPVGWWMSKEDIERVVCAIRDWSSDY